MEGIRNNSSMEVPTSWNTFRTKAPGSRNHIIHQIATSRFNIGEGNILIQNLGNLINSYRQENTFTTRCWYVLKSVFGAGDEWNSIQNLTHQYHRLLAESLVENIKDGYIKKNVLEFLTQFTNKSSMKENAALLREVMDRALFLVASSDFKEISNHDLILEALLEKEANPNRFYPLDQAIQTHIQKPNSAIAIIDQEKVSRYKAIRAATAFGMYMLSDGATLFTARADKNKGYICEPKAIAAGPSFLRRLFNVLPFSITVPQLRRWEPTMTVPVTEFLNQERLGWINQQ